MPGISFDRAVEYYDATRGYPAGVAERIRDAIVRETNANYATRFLELGVGTGRIALPFLQAGYSYTGVDLSLAMMHRLVHKLDQNTTPSTWYPRLAQADVTLLPFLERTFDVVLAVHVLHLVSDWQRVVLDAQRVLKPAHNYLLLAGDNIDDAEDASDPSPAARVRQKWNDLTRDLQGAAATRERRHIRTERIIAYLHEIGATTRSVQFVNYMSEPVSARAMADRLKARMYSSDWATLDATHTEAVRRLDEWLNTECANPDQEVATRRQFNGVLASWGVDDR